MLFRSSSRRQAYTVDTSAAALPGGYVVFSIDVTNQDSQGRPLVLDRYTALFDTYVKAGAANGQSWYIIGVDSNGNVQKYSLSADIQIPHQATATLYFGSGNPDDIGGTKAITAPQLTNTFLIFHGTLGGTIWGQNSPFVATLFVDNPQHQVTFAVNPAATGTDRKSVV